MLTLIRRILFLVNRRKLERELAIEMESHRAMMGDRAAAFGSELRHMEDTRAAWGVLWVDRLWQDLSYGARQLRRAPAFTFAAVAMLAIGIGINAGVFSLFSFSVLRPLPVRDPDSLLQLHQIPPGAHSTVDAFPQFAYAFYRDYNSVLRSVIAVAGSELTVDVETGEKARILFASGNYFPDLAAAPAYGRYLNPRDDQPAAEATTVLAYRFWETHFAADPSIVGRSIRINGHPVTVAGIASAEFIGPPMGAGAWLPLSKLREITERGDGNFFLYGRLRSGVTTAAGEQALTALAAEFAKQRPDVVHGAVRITTTPAAYLAFVKWDKEAVGPVVFGTTLLLLILVIGCLNLSNLLLARALTREREFSIRFSIGASRVRILRQLLTECLLLALFGGAAGLVCSALVSRILVLLLDIREIPNLPTDHRVALFTLAISIAATLVFGLAPAVRISRNDFRTGRLRKVLIAAQVGASMVLLVQTGLTVRAVRRNVSTDPGFAYESVVYVDPGLYSHSYSNAAAGSYLESLSDSLARLPGVSGVALATSPPLGERGTGVMLPGNPVFYAGLCAVTPGFFHTAGIPLVAGRDITGSEREVVVVSRALAARIWPNESVLGRRLPYLGTQPGPVGGAVVIGVAADVAGGAEAVYYPLNSGTSGGTAYVSALAVVRSNQDPSALPALARSAARALDPALTPSAFLAEEGYRDRLHNNFRMLAGVASLGLIALALAVSGIYGLLVYTVSHRTREIGIRMALGAGKGKVVRLILAEFARPILAGLFLGLFGGWIFVKLLRLDTELNFVDPAVTVGAIAIFLAATALSAIVPLRRALRLNPTEALRQE